jgi:hypothetical protein
MDHTLEDSKAHRPTAESTLFAPLGVGIVGHMGISPDAGVGPSDLDSV